jgi:hypothetical protein
MLNDSKYHVWINTWRIYLYKNHYFRPSSSPTTTIVEKDIVRETDMMMCFFTRARDSMYNPKFIEIREEHLRMFPR